MLLPQHYIFDLDGTLLDSARGIRQSLHHAMATVLPHSLGRNPPDVPIGPTIREMLSSACPELSHSTIEQLVDAYRAHYDSVGWMNCQLYPGVREMLHGLQSLGLSLLIATNKPRTVTRQLVTHFCLEKFFLAVASIDVSDPGTSNKGSLVRSLLRHYRLAASDCCLVGDRADDAHAACVNQVGFIWAAYGYGSPEEFVSYGSSCRRLREPLQLLNSYTQLSVAA